MRAVILSYCFLQCFLIIYVHFNKTFSAHFETHQSYSDTLEKDIWRCRRHFVCYSLLHQFWTKLLLMYREIVALVLALWYDLLAVCKNKIKVSAWWSWLAASTTTPKTRSQLVWLACHDLKLSFRQFLDMTTAVSQD